MKGTWVWLERTDTWHLVVDEIVTPQGDASTVTYKTWCGLELNDKAPRKSGVELSQWADIVHDECYRRSEEPE